LLKIINIGRGLTELLRK